jgi:signal transduction histidine kinase
MRRQHSKGSDDRRGLRPALLPDAMLDDFGECGDDEADQRFARGTVRIADIDLCRDPLVHRDGLREDDVAQIVHDLKNPLSTITLETQLLDDKLAKGEEVDVRATVARITHNVAFLERMVQDLLDSCALASGELQLRRRPTELSVLLAQIIDRAVPTRDRDRVVLDAPDPLTVSIDDLRIERVVANLIGNALKYAPRSSRITVRLRVDLRRGRIWVIDTGPGLTAIEMAFVFDKYRRTTSASAYEGSGLGLHVSKQIVEAHGGQIGVDSIHGEGARFFFDLPITS